MNKREIEYQIECAMAAGKNYDTMSDRAYGDGNPSRGERFGRLAIDAYTRAEKLSEQLDQSN